MADLEVLIYEATRQVFDDRYSADLQPIAESTQLEFEPIPDSHAAFNDHGYTVVRGGERPSYRLAVPGGEFFVHEFVARVKHRMAGEYEPVTTGSRTFVRTPQVKAADGVILVTMAQYREFGVVPLPLEGGKAIELLDDPLAATRAQPKKNAKAAASPAKPPVEPAPVAPLKPERKPLVVEWDLGPVKPAVKRTQLAMFADEPEPAGVAS